MRPRSIRLRTTASEFTPRIAVMAERVSGPDAPPMNDYTVTLVEGVAAHRERIDELLTEHAEGWTLNRMPAVDLAILRLGLYELLWATDVPDGGDRQKDVDAEREVRRRHHADGMRANRGPHLGLVLLPTGCSDD